MKKDLRIGNKRRWSWVKRRHDGEISFVWRWTQPPRRQTYDGRDTQQKKKKKGEKNLLLFKAFQNRINIVECIVDFVAHFSS